MNLYPDRIWDLFKQTYTHVPLDLADSDTTRYYQLFEVVFTKLMSILQPGCQWVVTPVQNDGGIDFHGEFVLFNIPKLSINARLLIGGQCKRTGNKRSSIQSLSSDLIKMIDNIDPAFIIIGLAAEITPNELQHSRDTFYNVLRRPLYIFGLEQIDALIRIHLEELTPILAECLSEEEAAEVLSHFSLRRAVQGDDFQVNVSAPSGGQTGSPFEVNIQIDSHILHDQTVFIRWNWINNTKLSPDDEYPPLRLVRPAHLSTEEGIPLIVDEGFSATLNIKFVGYSAAPHSLGTLEILAHGEVVKEVHLGRIKLAERYHPNFFWEPFEKDRIRFLEVLEQILSGHTGAMAIVGAGGSGKTRLCQEFGFLAEQMGSNWITISHENTLNHPYKLLGDTLASLVPSMDNIKSPGEAVYQRINILNRNLAEKAPIKLSAIFSWEINDQIIGFDKEYYLQVLLILLLDQLRKTSIVLHLSDLHWCHPQVLGIYSELLRRLSGLTSNLNNGLLILFEGRRGEELGLADVDKASHTTVYFEEFVAHTCEEIFNVKPLTTDESTRFLTALFEGTQATRRKVPTELIPHQQTLINEILRYAKGNPFHMVEQIKLLRYKSIIGLNKRTGLLFLQRKLSEIYQAPENVATLIEQRFRYVSSKSPETAILLRALALIKDRVDRGQYQILKEVLAPGIAESTLEGTEIISIPQNRFDEVSFLHENYYQVIRRLPFAKEARSKTVSCYLEWIDSLPKTTPLTAFERAEVLAEAPSPNPRTILKQLETAYSLAESQHQHLIAARSLSNQLGLRKAGTAKEMIDLGQIQTRLGELTIWKRLYVYMRS